MGALLLSAVPRLLLFTPLDAAGRNGRGLLRSDAGGLPEEAPQETGRLEERFRVVCEARADHLRSQTKGLRPLKSPLA